MRRLLPLLALLSSAVACRSPELTTMQDSPTPPARQARQVVEFPKLEDLDPELRKKAVALIAQLAAESFKDRREAREALMAMGPAIVPLLETYLDDAEPEIRNALPKIIESVRAKLNVTIPDLKLTLVAIKPGSFMMGSEKGDTAEKPVHKVTLTKPFWMGKTEVTQSQYESVMGESPSNFKGLDNPVEQVTWNDSVEFCKKLTTRERRAGRLPPNQEYRLPTEAEWEYCCRAGSDTKYCFGDTESRLGDYAWHAGNSGSKTHPVAGKNPNAWGLYDMHGNVWELCSDWSGNYRSGAQIDPTGPQAGLQAEGSRRESRVSRGGGWGSGARGCRSADRSGYTQSYRFSSFYGFRIVRARVAKAKQP